MVTPQPGDAVRVAFIDHERFVESDATVIAFDDGLLTVELKGSQPTRQVERTFNVRSVGFLWFQEEHDRTVEPRRVVTAGAEPASAPSPEFTGPA
jgi:hypothetical protein